jgi:CheY-like chemotaxis protein
MSLKILVADDSVTIQKIITLAFQDEGATFECVSEGEQVMDLVHTFEPDIVLVDAFMPGCSGYEICERIKDDPELESIPVLLLVGTFEAFDEGEAARVRCNGYLKKPFDTSELLQTVCALAEKRASMRRSEAGVGPSALGSQSADFAPQDPKTAGLRGLISRPVRDSFLGSDRILEVFDDEVVREARTALDGTNTADAGETLPELSRRSEAAVTMDGALTESALNVIVDRVVRRMSAAIIREVAWEVVPEISESIIRQTIEEQNRP